MVAWDQRLRADFEGILGFTPLSQDSQVTRMVAMHDKRWGLVTSAERAVGWTNIETAKSVYDLGRYCLHFQSKV